MSIDDLDQSEYAVATLCLPDQWTLMTTHDWHLLLACSQWGPGPLDMLMNG